LIHAKPSCNGNLEGVTVWRGARRSERKVAGLSSDSDSNDTANQRAQLAESVIRQDEESPKPSDASRDRILAEMVAHNKWLKGIDGGRRGKLSHVDLSGWTLAGVDFSRADLRGSSLSEAVLRNAVLDETDLFMADLEGADLRRASLQHANLAGARLNGADLRDADLTGVSLNRGTVTPDVRREGHATRSLPLGDRGAELRSARLERAVLVKADLSDCDLTGANLTGADLSGANLANALLADANLEDTISEGARFDGANFADAILDTDLRLRVGDGSQVPTPVTDLEQRLADHTRWLDSAGTKGRQLDLTNRHLDGCSFTGRDLTAARIRRCLLNRVVLDECILRQADLSGTSLVDSSLRGADLSGASLRRAFLNRVDLTDAAMVAIEIDGAAWPTTLEKAVLHDVELGGATVREVVMRGTRVSTQTLTGMRLCGVPAMVLRRLTVEEPDD